MARVPHWKPIRGPKEYTFKEFVKRRYRGGMSMMDCTDCYLIASLAEIRLGPGWRKCKKPMLYWNSLDREDS